MSRHFAQQNIFDNKLFHKVETVMADNVGLTHLPKVDNIIQLDEIFLSHNKIRRFNPKSFMHNKKLRRVLLDHNKIRIPKNLPLLISDSLDTLDLSFNGFRKIYPNTFKQLPNLRILYIQGNLIAHIPFYTFISLHKIKFLQLEQNPLRDFKFGIPKSLKTNYIIHEKYHLK